MTQRDTTKRHRPHRLLWLALLLICTQLTGCKDLGKKLDQWFPKASADDQELYQQTQRGQKLFKLGRYDDALQLFLSLQSQHPQRLDLMYNLGATHLKLGEKAKGKGDKRKSHFKKAETHLSGVLTKGSAQLRQKAHYNLGVLFTRKHQYEKALYHFEQADYLARKVLKSADKDAAANRDLLATLLRQRNRRRQKLNRTRVFRYEAKTIKLRASKAYNDPIRQIALKATFTHQGTGTKQVIWGYPTSQRRWEVRFVPTRTGKWRYNIKTIKRRIDSIILSKKTGPGKRGKITYAQTQIDKSLRDSGLFRVMPSARAGDLIIATANPTRLAWKKPKSALKLKQKKGKQAAKAKPKAKGAKGQMGPPTPRGKKPKKLVKTPDGKKVKPPAIPKDEAIIRWQGVAMTGLFDPQKVDDKSFTAHVGLLRKLAPSAIHVPIHLDRLLQWPKQASAAPTLADKPLQTLSQRLDLLRSSPTHKWAFVYVLQSEKALTPAQLKVALELLCAMLGHVDVLWSTSELPQTLAAEATKLLQRLDPYKQPIATKELPAVLKAQLATQAKIARQRVAIMKQWLAKQRKQAKNTQGKGKNSKGKKGKVAKKPKKSKLPKLPPIPKLVNKRFVLHTSHHVATSPKQLQRRLVTPWIVELPIFMGLDAKGLLDQWWKLYVSGVNATVALDRTFHADERKDINGWLDKAEGATTLPPHPDLVKTTKKATKKAAKKATNAPQAANKPQKRQATKVAKQAPKAASKAQAAKGKKAAKASSKASPKTSSKKKVAKKAKRTPKAKRISRPFIHYLMVRHRWTKFLNSFRFTGLVRPMMVRVKIPDMKGFKAALQKWRDATKKQKAAAKKQPKPSSKPAARAAKQGDKGKKAPQATSKPATAKKTKGPKLPKMPKMRWRSAGMRGFLAGNVTTTLFLAPPQKAKKPPQIRWRNRRMDMEFSWYNAETGKFQEKQVFRQVISLALVAPKKKAHIAKVVIKDHPVHTPYEVAIPHRFARVSSTSPWRARDWQLLVKPPKGPKQRLAVLLERRGYMARFRPDQPGFWRFTLLYKGKRLKGLWGYDGVVKAVPAANPMPLLRHPKMPKRFLAGVPPRIAPTLLFALPIPSLLSTWTDEQATTTIKQLKRQRPAENLIIAKLPAIPWKGFDQSFPKPKAPKKAAPKGTKAGAKAPKSKAAAKAAPGKPTKRGTPKVVKSPVIPGLALAKKDPAARLKFLQAIERLERRIAAVHKSGRLLGLMLSPSRWKALSPSQRQRRMFFLLDRFASAYPLLWLVDHRDPKSKPDGALVQLIKIWYVMRYPHPSFKRKPSKKGAKRQPPKKQVPPSAWPPLVGAAMGSPRSEKRLKATKPYDFLWLELKDLMKDTKDFKLHTDSRPILLTWKPLLQDDFSWQKKAAKSNKQTWDQAQLKAWARFIWRAQLMGFSHVAKPLAMPLLAPLASKKKKKKDAKPQPLTIAQLQPPAKIPAVMQAFFQGFNWSRLMPPIRSMGLKDYQAFGAETPYSPKGKSGQHHAVIWVNKTVSKELLLTQKTPLKKHRYVWINPLTGEQPVSPQLLPLPPKGKPNKLQVPFRPALLYVFRRPPQKRKQQRKNKRQQKKDPRMSKRQQVRNRLKNLKDDRNKMLKKMLGKQNRLSGKRG